MVLEFIRTTSLVFITDIHLIFPNPLYRSNNCHSKTLF